MTAVETKPKPEPGATESVPLTAAQLPRSAPLLLGVAAAGVGVLMWLLLDLGVTRSTLIGWLAFAAGTVVLSGLVEGRRKAVDRFVTVLVWTTFVVAVLPLLSLLFELVSRGYGVLSAEFFTASMVGVLHEGGGIYHALMGTLIITAIATAISVPIGVLAAVYLVEYGGQRRIARTITFLVDVMVGIPSIVAGLFAYALFAMIFGPGTLFGAGGSIALSVLMIPIVVRSTEEMLKLVPDELREASYALGVPKWRTITKVVIPTALAGIVTGVTLAVARVAGETAPLLLIAGHPQWTNFNPFDGQMEALPVFIYRQVQDPSQFNEARAWGAALVLVAIVMTLNLVARFVGAYFAPKSGR